MAVTGVYDELQRLDSMNQTWHGSFSNKSHASTNTKALKNVSSGVTHLIENKPMHVFNSKMALDDTNRFMTLNLKKRKPIFKNYIHNNASILRKEHQTGKLREAKEQERKNLSTYLDKISTKSSALERSTKTGPMNTI